MKFKKLVCLFCSALCLILSGLTVSATDYFNDLNQKLNQLNTEYGTSLHVLTEDEFLSDNYYELFRMSYDQYLKTISILDESDIMDIYHSANQEIEYISMELDQKSTRTSILSKTMYFNNSRNTMTIRYKYKLVSGDIEFDTSYLPPVTVSRVNPNQADYFTMTSYSGVFAESNHAYLVTAYGYINSLFGPFDKTFVVRFTI